MWVKGSVVSRLLKVMWVKGQCHSSNNHVGQEKVSLSAFKDHDVGQGSVSQNHVGQEL